MRDEKETKGAVTPSVCDDFERTQYQKDVETTANGPATNDIANYVVTYKTWCVVWILAWSYGISFWIVPSAQAAQTVIANQLGDPTAAPWYISVYTITVTIAFMVCGANSDLFGRRWFIIGGNVLLFIGFIVGGTATNNRAAITAFALIGFGAGNAQLAAFALPELLPNKWRHSAVVLADIGCYFAVVVGPVAGRFAAEHGEAWRWLFYGPAIAVFFSFCGLLCYYYPPQHPRGLPLNRALKELDYAGAILFTVSATLVLVGIVYTTALPSSNPKVIGTLAAGFALLLIFAIYEHFAPLKQPLTPTHVFLRGKGREFTAPFVVGFFYYGLNLIYTNQISILFTDPTTTYQYATVLTLPQNLGLVLGAVLLTLFGSKIGHWRWQLTGSVTLTVLFGALLALGTPSRRATMMAFVFLAETVYGWAQYLSITYIQFGVEQAELGISGGLAGVARFAGGAIAISVFTTILTNAVRMHTPKIVVPALEAAGASSQIVDVILEALPLGQEALAGVEGASAEVLDAARTAYQQVYVIGLRTTALSTLAFGIVGIVACLFCEDIGRKMNDKIEIFLENDVHAERNEYH
ncbi:hypothetical protein PRZ48_011636 [Zasmidium cellare]|uniref:Major facilitator superfamily (MFS) profile domain-containing protein n=1 Tax=Zasmidium cellare TaxID=395010 RepID=A0ABR0E7J4_ZASCE|nr:hypothetical protein PRZ48_011636 [Zasmidium cellare]